MTLRRRMERLEQRLAHRQKACRTVFDQALRALSDSELDSFSAYVEAVELGSEPSPAALAAAERYNSELEVELRAAGFRSQEAFDRACESEIARRPARAQYKAVGSQAERVQESG